MDNASARLIIGILLILIIIVLLIILVLMKNGVNMDLIVISPLH